MSALCSGSPKRHSCTTRQDFKIFNLIPWFLSIMCPVLLWGIGGKQE